MEDVFPQSQAFRGVWDRLQMKAVNKLAMTKYISTSKRITAIIARSPLLGCQKPTTNADPFTNMPEQKRFFNPHRMLNTVVERDLWEEEWLIPSLTESSNRSSFSSIAQELLPRRRRMGPRQVTQWILSRVGPPGGTPLYGLYVDVPLFYLSAARVCPDPKQGI